MPRTSVQIHIERKIQVQVQVKVHTQVRVNEKVETQVQVQMEPMPPPSAPSTPPSRDTVWKIAGSGVMGALPDGLVLSTAEVQFVSEAHRNRNTQRKYGDCKHSSKSQVSR